MLSDGNPHPSWPLSLQHRPHQSILWGRLWKGQRCLLLTLLPPRYAGQGSSAPLPKAPTRVSLRPCFTEAGPLLVPEIHRPSFRVGLCCSTRALRGGRLATRENRVHKDNKERPSSANLTRGSFLAIRDLPVDTPTVPTANKQGGRRGGARRAELRKAFRSSPGEAVKRVTKAASGHASRLRRLPTRRTPMTPLRGGGLNNSFRRSAVTSGQ